MTDNYLITDEKPDSVEGFTFQYKYLGAEQMMLKDSYDYLLLNKGFCLLTKVDGSGLLFSAGSLARYDSCDDAELVKRVDGIVSPRVLLPKHEFNVSRFSVSMLDELEKTIAKGITYIIETGGKAVCAMGLSPLRGYGKETAKGLRKIEGNEGGFGDAVKLLVDKTGDELIFYSAKPVLKLNPETPIYKVMGEIYTHLIDVMSKNTDGIINDVDIEFLHDFRVSVRRIRSALSLVRGVFDKDMEKEFRVRFKNLGGLTGVARDMDVYLDRIEDYERMLPGWLKGGMAELADYFKKTREAEYRKLSDYLLSGEFEKLCTDWINVVSDDKYAASKGKKPVLPLAKKAIRQAFNEIEKQADGMSTETHSDAVHEIRISFKKIRYLLEFYSSLFDKEKTAPMLKDMKALQDSLGDHNDYYVQQLALEELVENGKWSPQTASACGFLSAVLAERQMAEREKALRLIIQFMRYKPLFGELFK
ncbi:CHAD domain-containing protein [Deferribacteres bacterium DY0037]